MSESSWTLMYQHCVHTVPICITKANNWIYSFFIIMVIGYPIKKSNNTKACVISDFQNTISNPNFVVQPFCNHF